jgi:hypothetical protein
LSVFVNSGSARIRQQAYAMMVRAERPPPTPPDATSEAQGREKLLEVRAAREIRPISGTDPLARRSEPIWPDGANPPRPFAGGRRGWCSSPLLGADGLGLGVVPLHGPCVAHRGDPQEDLAVLEEPDGPGGLADDHGQRPRDLGDRRRPVVGLAPPRRRGRASPTVRHDCGPSPAQLHPRFLVIGPGSVLFTLDRS